MVLGLSDYRLKNWIPVVIFCVSTVTLGAKSPTKETLYKLAIEEARRLKLDNKPEARSEIDKILYKEYLKAVLKEKAAELEPSEKEMRAAYAQSPRIRLRHLAVMGTAEHRESKIRSILAQRKAGKSFKELVLRYSDDNGAKFAGDLDFKGENDLPDSIYQAALDLKPGEVSKAIELGEATHLVEVIAVESFEKAPAVYKAYLRGRLRRDKELAVLRRSLDKLAQKPAAQNRSEKGTE